MSKLIAGGGHTFSCRRGTENTQEVKAVRTFRRTPDGQYDITTVEGRNVFVIPETDEECALVTPSEATRVSTKQGRSTALFKAPTETDRVTFVCRTQSKISFQRLVYLASRDGRTGDWSLFITPNDYGFDKVAYRPKAGEACGLE